MIKMYLFHFEYIRGFAGSDSADFIHTAGDFLEIKEKKTKMRIYIMRCTKYSRSLISA